MNNGEINVQLLFKHACTYVEAMLYIYLLSYIFNNAELIITFVF